MLIGAEILAELERRCFFWVTGRGQQVLGGSLERTGDSFRERRDGGRGKKTESDLRGER